MTVARAHSHQPEETALLMDRLFFHPNVNCSNVLHTFLLHGLTANPELNLPSAVIKLREGGLLKRHALSQK